MTKTVVLVDDDQDDLDILKEAIASIDETVVCVCFVDPADALHAISDAAATIPHFIFTDINMPGISGDRLVRELRNQRAFDQTVITVLSTSMPQHVAQQLVRDGADHTFQKPVHIKEYYAILTKILKNNRERVKTILR